MIIKVIIDGVHFTHADFISDMNRSLKLNFTSHIEMKTIKNWKDELYDLTYLKKDISIFYSDDSSSILYGCVLTEFDGYIAKIKYDYILHYKKVITEDIKFKNIEEFQNENIR
jgi:hypothetical protein